MQFALSILSTSCCLASFHLSEEKMFRVFQSLAVVHVLASIMTSVSSCETLRRLSSSFSAFSVSGRENGVYKEKYEWGHQICLPIKHGTEI